MEYIFKYYMQGLLLGLAYVAPIGMQNLYVINTALKMKRLRVYQVAMITTIFDISLGLACFFGIGVVLNRIPVLNKIILVVGSIIVIYIGVNLIRTKVDLNNGIKVDEPILKIIFVCFSVTWLNPQAIIDGTLLLGSFRASIPSNYSSIFIIGVASASFFWFTGISTIVSFFKNVINSRRLKIINIICGAALCYFGLGLIYNFIKII